VLRGFAAGGGPSPAVQAKEEAEEQSKAEGGRTTPMTREVMDTQASQQRAAEDSAVREAAAVAAARRTEELARREQEIEDALFHELDRKRTRNEYVWHPPPGAAPSLLGRAKELVKSAYASTRWVVVTLVGVPGKLRHALATKSLADWRASASSTWQHIKEEAHHYWVGTKLLYVEVGVASDLVGKLLHGKSLSRREKAQLTRTAADLFRLVPMLVFVLVPFMELLLPVALKLFPNMLPSTFEDKLKKEEELRKRLALKMQVARFLQDTVAEMAKEIKSKKKGSNAATAAELYQFMGKVRAGEPVSNEDIRKFASLFNDELTLDNLERVQLQSMLTFVGLPPYGTDGFLKNRLRHHVAEIKEDDAEILQEGVTSLSDSELRDACRARGMRPYFGEHGRTLMERNLQGWLELSKEKNMPTSLLLLSRVFTVTQSTSKVMASMEEQIKETIGSLPDEVLEDVSLQTTASSAKSKAAELQKKLALVKREKERIEEERLEAVEEEEVLKEAAAEEARKLKESLEPGSGAGEAKQHEIAYAAARAVVKEAAAHQSVLNRQSNEERAAWIAEKREKRMQEIISALAVLASHSGVSDERHDFMRLVKQQIMAMDEHMAERGSSSLAFTGGRLTANTPLPEDEIITDVSDKVTHILKRMEKELDHADGQIKANMQLLDLDGDGMISEQELSHALGFMHRQMGEDELRSLLTHLNCTKDGTIKVESLMGLAQRDMKEFEEVSQRVAKGLENTLASKLAAEYDCRPPPSPPGEAPAK